MTIRVEPPEGLRRRGLALWETLDKAYDLAGPSGVLAVEACRTTDRLDKLDDILRDRDEWLTRRVDIDAQTVIVTIDAPLAEARQQQNALRQTLATLGVATLDEQQSGGDGVDDVAARRAARRAAAEAG